MKVLSSIEIRAVVEELQQFVDGKIDQVYQPDSTELVFSIHKTGEGRKLLRIVPGVALYVARKKRKVPVQPPNFCRFLRKRIKGARITKIKQKEFERIVEFHLDAKEEKFVMMCEFFSKGNVILCNEEMKIISALQVQLWKDRKVRAREIYRYPPSKPIKFDDYQDFAYFIERSDKKTIVQKLATLNLGGVYAEEVCYRAKVNKTNTQVGDRELRRLYMQLLDVLGAHRQANIARDQPVPIIMESLGDGEMYTSYSEALDVYYQRFIKDWEELEDEKKQSKVDKYKEILRLQQQQVDGVTVAIGENKEKGDWVYANYQKLQEIIKLYKGNRHEELKVKGVKVDGTSLLVEE
tara:strand:+ start:6436 stop:7488 length:1053 start_codon:yes stop_codon:yes gene_type:complete